MSWAGCFWRRPGAPPSRHQLAPPGAGGSGRLEAANHPQGAPRQLCCPRRPEGPQQRTPCSRSARSTSTSPSGPSMTRPGGPSGRRPARSGAEEIPQREGAVPAARRGWNQRNPRAACRSCLPWSGPLPPNETPQRHGSRACTGGPAGARHSPPAARNCARAVMAKGDTARTWAEDPASGSPPRPDPRRAPGLLGLDGHRGAPPYRHSGSRMLTELSHHKAWSNTASRPPASSSRCCRSPRPRPTPNGSWSSAPSSADVLSAVHHPDPRPRRRRSPSLRPTTTTRRPGTSRCRCCFQRRLRLRGPAYHRPGHPRAPEHRPGQVRPHRHCRAAPAIRPGTTSAAC